VAASAAQRRAHNKWRAANRDKMLAAQKRWREANREHASASVVAWKARNPGRIAAHNAAYKSAVRGQVPVWADMAAINALYLEARELGLTVDHVIPLRGKKVCGLHVENNLRLVTHSENSSKGNKLLEAA
jgi:hypothetical protein